MAMKRVDVMMGSRMIRGADQVAARRGVSRSALIKGLLATEIAQVLGPEWLTQQDSDDDQQEVVE
jgi:metal-responsive CopG/Arc/MetJ family transcriptional regulator